ncbi:transposase [Methanosarcina sp. DH2]|uniref:transposase n=1 Tax=Methanosarcina sp. DH2 TaxID=2605639 RepID=UPI001E39435C|nr:transposase [Methanosarcina sp. DH2]MCC4769465.1 transposase [Methanosarcina sp. DH2]
MTKKTKCTPELIERMKENVKLGFTYSALALSLGISEDTLYSWIRKGRDEQQQPYVSFYAALKEAEADLLAECLQQLKLSMKMGNVESAKFMLERRFNNMGYGKQSQVDVKSQNLNMNSTVPMTHEQTEAMRADILSKLTPTDRIF